MTTCSVAVQVKLEDQIPFVDAEGSCDGSVSSIGTGSLLGHSSTSDEFVSSENKSRLQPPWRMQVEDQDSLNNILDTVPSSSSHDDLSLEESDCNKIIVNYDTVDGSKVITKKKDPFRAGCVSLMTAYTSLSEQTSDGYESIYNNSVSYGYGGSLLNSPTKSINSVPSVSPQPHHYISSYRARSSLSRKTGSKAAAAFAAASAAASNGSTSSSVTLDRGHSDLSFRLAASLRQRYQQLCDDLPATSWCPEFRPHVRQMIFSLARDSSWEKGGPSHSSTTNSSGPGPATRGRIPVTPQRQPNLRRIPLHGILAEDRRSERPKSAGGQRVLIMGETGFGKTTLLLRLLYDWSSQESALGGGYLSHFKLVHFLSCRDFTGQWKSLFGPVKEEAELGQSLASSGDVESQTLFLLDGLDELSGWPEELAELLEGRLYPASTVLATSRPVPAAVSHPAFHKRIVIHGLELPHVEGFIRSYFARPLMDDEDLIDDDSPPPLIELLRTRPRLMKLASNPLMCFLLCLVFQEEDGHLPDSVAELFSLLMRFIMSRTLQQKSHMSTQQRKVMLDFGRLCLQGIKENRYIYTDAEIKSSCQTLDITKWGFLLKGLNVNIKGQKRTFYQPIHSAWSEYAAAQYLSSISHYANIIQREVYSLPLDAEPCLTTSAGIHRSSLQVLFFLCSVLSKKAYLLFNMLSPLDFPVPTLLAFLQTSGKSNVNVAAICKLIQGHASVSTASEEQLDCWAALVDHPSCLLHSMAIRYDGGNVDGVALQSLVDVLSRNTTLHTIRVSAVVGQGLESPSQLEQVARQLRRIMGKPKLQTLELAFSSLSNEEEVPGEESEPAAADALQPLVDALCVSIGGTAVSKLVLDAELSGAQVGQLCLALPSSSVRSLHLLHLSCAWSGLQSLTELLLSNSCSVTGLDLSGCWAASVSSSVVQADGTLGSMTGSSSCSTAGSPPATPTAVPGTPNPLNNNSPRPKKDAQQQQFLSLPRKPTRGARSYSSLTRTGQQGQHQQQGGFSSSSGYLSRTDEKRRSDSMLFQKVLLPLPACDRSSHLQCGFHLLFDALRQPSCRLTQLNLTKASLNVSDAMCLGESLRKNRTLVSLRLEGLSSLKEVLPVCLSLAENKALQLLDVSSSHVTVNDSAFQLICRALGRNCTLQSLRMCGWTFCLEEEDTFKALSDAIQSSRLRELALSGCLIRVPFQGHRRSALSSALLGPVVLDDLVALMSKDVSKGGLLDEKDRVSSDWLAFLKLDNVRLELSGKLTLRGAHLVCFTTGFQRLNELNLAVLPEETGSLSNSVAAAEPLRDKASLAFFQSLAQHCAQLRTLVLHNWRFSWSKPDKVLKGIAKSLKNMSLSNVSLDGLTLQSDPSSSVVTETLVALMMISALPNLTNLSLNGWRLRTEDAIDLGKAVRDKLSSTALELSLKGVPSQTARLMVRTAGESGRVAAHLNGSLARFKKTGRAPSFLDKMMGITSSRKE